MAKLTKAKKAVPLTKVQRGICVWVGQLPTTLDKIELAASGLAGAQPDVIAELDAAQVGSMAKEELAILLHTTAEEWSDAHQRELRCTLTASRADALLSKHAFRAGLPSDDGNLDGSTESLVSQTQRHLEAMARIHANGHTRLQAGWDALLGAQGKRIAELEAELTKARSRVKTGDGMSEAEAAIAVAELETTEQRSARNAALMRLVLERILGEDSEIVQAARLLLSDPSKDDKKPKEKDDSERPKPETKADSSQ